ncbi:MAG: hypothetical protein LBO65_06130 [Spirochaetaceae bacterium]|jgi:hypothetical protein|nr:hypothetical protein [Spirochaetaceae bacterium]
MRSIGTEHESTLHRELKLRYALGGGIEIERAGFVCDAQDSQGRLVEIQTGSFGPLKKKLPILTAQETVRLIHPVIVTKTIELFDTQGKLISRRKSPRKGSLWNLFDQMIYAPQLAELPNLTVEVVLLDAVERRIADGKGSWRRRGISVHDRSLERYRETIPFFGPPDYRNILPFRRGEKFSSALLAERAGIRPELARKTLYVLTAIKAVKRLRKEGQTWVYTMGNC